MSVNGAGSDSGNGQSGGPSLDQFVVSPDGTKVAFQSKASDLGPTDTNGATDVYVRDLAAGTTTLVSANAAGTDSGNSASGGVGGNPSFSADGTKLAFDSLATNLTATPDTNESGDVFVRDLTAGTTTLVSTNIAGTAAANSLSTSPVFDPAGDNVAFTSFGTNVAAADTNATGDVFLRNLTTGTTALVSVNGAGTDGGNGNSGGQGSPVAFSPDGSRITFASSATNLGPTDTNGTTDGYVRDLSAGTTALVSVNAAGTNSGNARSFRGTFSPDGTRILFTSQASDLGPTDGNGVNDVYVRDLTAGTTMLVSADAGGTGAGNGASNGARFGPGGATVAFTSAAGNLGPADANGVDDVYLRDLTTGTTALVSTKAGGGNGGNQQSSGGWFSPDGSRLAFVSAASDLGVNDTNGVVDVYVRNLAAGTTALVSANVVGTDGGNGRSADPAFARDADTIVFASAASNLGPTDTNTVTDLYVASPPPTPCETTTTTSPTSTTTTSPTSTTTTSTTAPPAPEQLAAAEPCETTTTTVCSTSTTSPTSTSPTTAETTTTTTTTTTTSTTSTSTTTTPPAPGQLAVADPCEPTTTTTTTTEPEP